MTSFRPPRAQARFLVRKKTKHGQPRHSLKPDAKKFISSLGSERTYRGCTERFLIWAVDNKHPTSNVSASIAEDFLREKGKSCTQKTVDQYRQSLAIAFDIKLTYIRSECPQILIPRAYRYSQIMYLVKSASPLLSLSIRIAFAAGLRAIELDTIGRPSDFPEDKRDWLAERFVGREDEISFVVIGKGGLRRVVKIPVEIAEELEQHRLPEVIDKRQREIIYKKRYSLIGGQNFSQQFSRLSFHLLGWSTGAHGLRHTFAKQRISILQKMGFTWDYALKIVAQEMGHFSVTNTLAYMR